jgi:nanoRNase/pAp phosphatase (c-di-AMP/oligoRNAs hydrolase)
MKVSPQDSARIVIDHHMIDKTRSDRERINREVQAKTTLDDEIKKSKIEQN